jgi:hypothetical protein
VGTRPSVSSAGPAGWPTYGMKIRIRYDRMKYQRVAVLVWARTATPRINHSNFSLSNSSPKLIFNWTVLPCDLDPAVSSILVFAVLLVP